MIKSIFDKIQISVSKYPTNVGININFTTHTDINPDMIFF